MSNILVVTTSVPSYRVSGRRTGLWLGELTHFVDAVEAAGHTTTIASIDGGFVPIDPESLGHEVLAQGGTRARYDDPAFMARIANTPSLNDIDASDFDAIYLTGGHGVMFDFPDDARLATLLREFDEAGKVVSAVCHGTAGLLGATKADGAPLIAGRRISGFSWNEEVLAGLDAIVPFNLEERIAERGATYIEADEAWAPFAVTDGNVVTGQNPASAHPVAQGVLTLLDKK
ncbi:ThiJ/PfpI domain protein OS=Tsukamurella paurometabola (strain ATCC 8368 / DSM / CCUG 35730/ CIP 100753 / JCM 10117 / KCTC 9821 / NBRC 16120 / NCIMB 702349/ NCTC 13040) OX=521096 GN=Tpau_3087 PE=4 SV=1 [Tsukamurella paurometabola]|uniref:ThiJ/PfpI domain protein n=1 Tax=Tsukamurella paurometabola (strain ATCC 8368 / DSM 20162 / CCUG 35730 / CIP 100753 / JCM 10117 / KCTC 9821 / NBRC 16120 / NCIMB 702349 / NCTC 13040) TaxID=521096 RepID=D5UUW1_TSUPD|nr:type 1 glutamine amidotransferase domain-containing protein [Tsukamurella paurometabola]ADG79679.1 ThiJ/PfpI domain protein [Tsukamurella paurometabola DSM 20162]SUP36729.1 chaperone protein HchA [Tsukamurella paurometabola]